MKKVRYSNYFDLVLYKAYSHLKEESERTYVGYIWWIIEPLLFMLVFYLVFGLFLKRGTEHYVPFLLIGLITWRWFQSTLMQGASSILTGSPLIQQVYIPKVLLPSASVLISSFKFAFVFSLLLVFLWVYGFSIGVAYMALPIVLLAELLLILGITFILAGIMPFLPDLKLFLEEVLRGGLFLSGVFFSGTSIPESFQTYFYLNPMANLVEMYRNVLLFNQWPSWQALFLIMSLSFLGLVIGIYVLQRNDLIYPKVV